MSGTKRKQTSNSNNNNYNTNNSPKSIPSWLLVIYATPLVILSLCIYYLVNQHVDISYVDEIFHIPQTQKYCKHIFNEWDDKITTLPGLYVFAWIYVELLSPLLSLFNSSININDTICSLSTLRSFNALLVLPNFIVVYLILKSISNNNGKQQDYQSLLFKTYSLVLFPIFYFFHFLYYTDVLSTLSVLISYYYSLNRKYTVSSLFGLIGIFIRQTNICWLFFIASVSVLNEATRKKYISNDNDGLVKQIKQLIIYAFKNIFEIIKLFYGYVIVGIAFLVFLKINGGIVVGDKSNHESSFHFPQILYFSLLLVGFDVFSAISDSKLNPLTCIKTYFTRLRQQPLSTIIGTLVCVSVLAVLIDKFTIHHRFILADNRHYTFYLWNRLFLRYPLFKYSLIPLYMYSIYYIKTNLSQRNCSLWILFYTICTSLVLLPSPLVEPRYYLVPFLIYQCNTITSKRTLFVQIIYYLLINTLTIGIFLYRPFTYPDGTTGRFFW
ncbi:hypothetical protein CYY_008909 [Polysphondylium violaceum]|uniref:Dol-P-Glc:Glc(2)Man(9)GlcNAc(2)-PP-Dol alpha-1,2-glucosyltransferase n=1 Tax=Polysphondylium violaceum TaxID=133409 RepID=A0A8J4PMS2_9MYCE|nr:hypothetical protein CYY_008909 [Polysphondylium violaceum]